MRARCRSGAGEGEPEDRERAEKRHRKAWLIDFLAQDLLHRIEPREGLLRIHLPHDGAHGIREAAGSIAERTASIRCKGATTENGNATTGVGSFRMPAFRVLPTMPMIVTSDPRPASVNALAGGCSRKSSFTVAPIGFSPEGNNFTAASLMTAMRSPRRTSDSSNIRPARSEWQRCGDGWRRRD